MNQGTKQNQIFNQLDTQQSASRVGAVKIQLFRLFCLLLVTFFIVQLSGLSPAISAISASEYFILLLLPLVSPTSKLFWLSLTVIVAAWSAFMLIRSQMSVARVLAYHLLFYLLIRIGFWLVGLVSATGEGNPSRDFAVFYAWENVSLLIITYLLTFATTWAYWSIRNWTIVEGVCLAIILGLFLRGHHNYQLDAPKELSTLAWQLRVDAEYVFLGIGFAFVSLALLLFVLSHKRPLFRVRNPLYVTSKAQRLLTSLAYGLILATLFVATILVQRYYDEKRSLGSEGVGTAPQNEGESNLSFSSAVTKTRHPAALLRLEGDYKDNPWAPMLYLREGALSSFNGIELVAASPGLDTDVPRIRPGEPFIELVKPTMISERTNVTQSIYLLAKHANPFALDFPKTIRMLKNPDPQRFLLGYQALSAAPTVKLEDLIGEEVGDTTWGELGQQNYFRAPGSRSSDRVDSAIAQRQDPVLDHFGEDLRYKAYSQLITAGEVTPVGKAIKIVNFLSQQSIYTRTPGHQVTTGGDPVAPYLFSEEKRGYCVHFSHAAVYLLRHAGIPARIGTGYLTDMTYAKDGHVLLQLGDRHAWPEIYVRGHGWIVADIQPARAENEPTLVPDEKLLEELMSKLEPSDPMIVDASKQPMSESIENRHILEAGRRGLIAATIFLLSSFVCLKLWLRFAWMLPAESSTQTRRAYWSFASELADRGWFRRFGETRQEYASRMQQTLGISPHRLTDSLEVARYSAQSRSLDTSKMQEDLTSALPTVGGVFGRIGKVFLLLSPLSLRRIFRW